MKRILTVLLAALLVLSLSLPVFAEVSPTPGNKPNAEVKTSDPNAGTVEKEDLGDGRFRFTAKPAPGHDFQGWEFETDGEIEIEGDPSSPDIIVKVTKDVTATAKFTESEDKKGDDSSTSPTTGDITLVVVAVVVTLAGAAFFCKKIFA